MDMNMAMSSESSAAAPTASNQGHTSYFSYGQHGGAILAHIVIMSLGWCFVLPAAVLLSVGRSRLAIPSQFLFLVLNAMGLLLGVIYNTQTPNLYENNAHHKIGWIVTSVISAQVVLALLFAYAGRGDPKESQSMSRSFNDTSFLPIATDEHESLYPTRSSNEYSSSRDSVQETEPISSIRSALSPPYDESQAEYDFEKPEEESHRTSSTLRGWLYGSIVHRFLSKLVTGRVSNRVLRIFNVVYDVIDRIILPFGFIAIATGAVTYAGIFQGGEIFNGLAHFIKGGIFFWYGIITLGRSIGAWADLGWAWNQKPPVRVVGWKARVPSGEFVESLVIFLYGVTNVFLEHLAGWGQEWTARDLEHVSILIMFFGGGLAGMLVESRRIRDALNSTLLLRLTPTCESDEDKTWRPPNSWGKMLVGFAVARGMTYILLFLRPPTSYLPARPPTEIVAAFCLMSGGLIFMLSARDVIESMEFYELDAMFIFTVVMGFTAFIMSLVILAIALKAWAVKRERAR
ncbi:hypothetical protein BDV11DRAFT_216175 [Aspergillus similis]